MRNLVGKIIVFEIFRIFPSVGFFFFFLERGGGESDRSDFV